MPDHLTYAALFNHDKVVQGDLMPPNSPASLLTHAAAVEAKAAWLATQSAKNKDAMWRTFLTWRVAEIGHNLTVTGRMVATFYHNPPRFKGWPPFRCYDGIVVADGKGGIEHWNPYSRCCDPDIYDMGAYIMAYHWRLYYLAVNPIDKAIVEDAIMRAIRHCTFLENKAFAREVRRR